MMDITRNQFFFAGLLCLLLGMEFHMVDSFELTPEFTEFLADRTGHPLAAVNDGIQLVTQSDKPPAKKTVYPPDSIGWGLISFGSVLILHSWGMKIDLRVRRLPFAPQRAHDTGSTIIMILSGSV